MSLSKTKLQLFRSLHQSKGRSESGLFIIEGAELIKEALKVDYPIKEVVLANEYQVDNPTTDNILKLLKFKGIPHELCTNADIERIADAKTPQGVVAIAKLPVPPVAETNTSKADVILICECISDPGNLGAIIRTADWFGLDEIILGPDSADPFGPKVVRSTAGSIFHVKVRKIGEIGARIKLEQKSGRMLFATSSRGKLDSFDLPHTGKRGLLMGHETRGVSERTIPFCEATVRIPGEGKAESLNLAVATGILLYEMTRS